jgi:hypothetical protein
LIIAKSDNVKIEIHETTYARCKTLTLISFAGRNRSIRLARLMMRENNSTLETIYGSSRLPNTVAQRYYENVKSSYLKTFKLKEMIE